MTGTSRWVGQYAVHGYVYLSLMTVYLSILLGTSGCTKRVYELGYPGLTDGKYDTEFPAMNGSKQLARISNSVKKLNVIAYYKSFYFSYDDQITETMLHDHRIWGKAQTVDTHSQTGIGTATVIHHANHRIALLTCAHVVSEPDTILSYYYNIDGERTWLQSVSIKQKQQNFVSDMRGVGELEILIIDQKRDIAVVGKEGIFYSNFIKLFEYPLGRTDDLEWGSSVYLIGYPMGYKMITRGIVSNPRVNASGSFLLDALFNRGLSGGLVLAVRDGATNLELVGLAKSVSAESGFILTPEQDIQRPAYDPHVPYDGKIYVHQKRHINYGITHAITIETIQDFFKDNEVYFLSRGYDFSHLFN